MVDFVIGDVDGEKLKSFVEKLRYAYRDKGPDSTLDASEVKQALQAALEACGDPASAYLRHLEGAGPLVNDAEVSLSCDGNASPLVRAAAMLIYSHRRPDLVDFAEIDLVYATVAGDDVGHDPSP